ncbi:hypothetical protein ACFL2C_02110 [Patescibacteria group bacterium]
MAKVFYDKLISLNKLEREIKKISTSLEEREELWHLVDGLMHHRILAWVLDNLELKHHDEFLVRLYNRPHDENLLKYLKKKIKIDVEEFLKAEAHNIMEQVLKDIKKHQKKKK